MSEIRRVVVRKAGVQGAAAVLTPGSVGDTEIDPDGLSISSIADLQDALDARVLDTDTRLSDQRVPVDGSVTLAKLNFDPATQAELDAHTTRTDNPHATTQAQVGLSNVDNTSDLAKPISTATQTALNAKVDLDPNTGKVLQSQLPAITIGESFTVGSQSEMLALTAQIGDVAIRTDLSNAKFVLLGTSSSTLSNWSRMEIPDAVVSVAGRTGAIVLDKTDVGLGNADNTSDANKPISTATQTALNAKISVTEAPLNVKRYGALGDGSANDTTSILAALTAMPSISGSFSGSSGQMYFPAGRYIFDGGFVVPSTKRMTVFGDGDDVTFFYRSTGSTATDYFTFNARQSAIEKIGIDGARTAAGASGDGIVFNAGNCSARNVTVRNMSTNGITIGKAGGSINLRLYAVIVNNCAAYGIETVGSSGSTDGMWDCVNVGFSGLSAVRLGEGAQNILNLHTWGSGLFSNTNNHGILIASSGNQLGGYIGETNMGDGVRLISGAHANGFYGGEIWGNATRGLYGFGSDRNRIVGVGFRNNGINNTGGSTGAGFANIVNEGGREWSIVGNNCFDDGSAIAAPSYSSTPTYSFPGRTAQLTVSAHYYETNTGTAPDNNSLVGNIMRKERTRTGVPFVLLGANNKYEGNNFGVFIAAATGTTYSATTTDEYIVTSNAAGCAVTLPAASSVPRYKPRTIDNSGAADSTITNTVSGTANRTIAPNAILKVQSDGTNWRLA